MTDDLHGSESGSTLDNWETDINSVIGDTESMKLDDVMIWPKLLGVATKPSAMDDWDQLYNLNNQCTLRNDCRKLAKSLNNKRNVPELESFMTLYCKRRGMDYVKNNGWIEVLEKIILLNIPQEHEFNVFFAFTTKYIPKDTKQGSQIYDLFRLLLQYHDPQLSNYMDSLHCSSYEYAKDWFSTLFATNMSSDACHGLWKIYIEHGDPFLVFHLSLVFLINSREEILQIPTTKKEKAITILTDMCTQLTVKDVPDFVQLAIHYSDRTPECLRKEFHYILFGANFDKEVGDIKVNKLLCLPIPAIDLTTSEDEISSGKVNFFVVDARSNEDFDDGHFVTSFNLNCASIVDAPEKFELALTSLEDYKTTKRADDHYLFLGYGDDSKDKYMNMLIAMFIKKSRPHVSFVQGGYEKLHNCISDTKRWDLLSMHSEEKCSLCKKESKASQGWGIMSRMKSVITNTSTKVKEKVEAAVMPITTKESAQADVFHHVDPKERHGKRYKQQSVFTIDDNSDDEQPSTQEGHKPKEEILLSAEFTETFECKEVFRDGEINGHLGLTRTHLHVLHDVPGKPGYVTTEARHALSTVVAVSSRRSIPELLTFKFGYEMNGELKITAVHKLFIPKAGECAKSVKTAIFALRPLPDMDDTETEK